MSPSTYVLIIDDRDADAELTLRAVHAQIIDPTIVRLRDGEAAAQFLFRTGLYKDRPAICPGLIVMDLHIPKVHGLQLLERLRRDPMTREIRVAVLASNLNPLAMQSAYSLGARAYLGKPADPEAYVAEVAKVIARCLTPKLTGGVRSTQVRISAEGCSPSA
jgi:CheY-like chemotaxis protein